MEFEYFRIIDLLGTVAFAASGVYAAMAKKLDLFGVIIIAFVTAIGGGTIRDLMVGDLPVAWIRNLNYTVIILITTAVVILFRNFIRNFRKTLLVFDSIGLGMFTILGIQKGIAFGLHPFICVALGTVTGCFGGILRDMLLNNIPVIFQKEIYASACIIGGTFYFIFGLAGVDKSITDAASIIIVFLIRMVSIKYNWHLPDIYRYEIRKKRSG